MAISEQLPVITEDPYEAGVLENPYPLFTKMREAGPGVWLDKYEIVAFARDEQVREILIDHETFISGAGVGPKNLHHETAWRTPGILESDPPTHTQMRTAMADVISPKGVRNLREQFQAYADELVDALIAQRHIDGIKDLAEVFPLRAFGDAVGIPREGRAENLIPHGAMNFSSFGPLNEIAQEYFKLGEPSHEWVMSNCARENLSPTGLGAQIWAHADAGTITTDQAALLVRAMLSAGLDTTILSLGLTLAELLEHPQAWAEVHQNPRMVKFAIDEAFRHDAPFQSFYRTTSREITFHGIDIPADTKVLVFPGSANRDATKWGEDADQYKLDRQAGGHLTFGMGIHQCVGQPISRLEMDILLTTLATKVKEIRPTGPRVPFIHTTLRGWKSIPMEIIGA